jgi:hypothetical protein
MANQYEMCGAVKRILDPKTFSKGFTKREFVLVTEEDRPQLVLFACLQQQCGLLDSISVDDRVRVQFRISGREWQDKVFVNLEAVRIEKMGADGSSVALDAEPPPAPPPPEDDGIMPF